MPAFIVKNERRMYPRGHVTQAMKPNDALLKRWQSPVARKDPAPAIFNTRGQVDRTFRGIDDGARGFESKIDSLDAGSVIAVQIGNHEDWPSILIACLRRGVVVLPLEQSISDQQRDAALKTCKVSGIAAAGVSAGRNIEIVPMRSPSQTGISAATTNWGKNRPSLLKLTSGTTA